MPSLESPLSPVPSSQAIGPPPGSALWAQEEVGTALGKLTRASRQDWVGLHHLQVMGSGASGQGLPLGTQRGGLGWAGLASATSLPLE